MIHPRSVHAIGAELETVLVLGHRESWERWKGPLGARIRMGVYAASGQVDERD